MVNDRSQVDEIRNRLSIVDVISDTVTLKRAGNTFKGLCPFHSEKTPSFNVAEDRGLYKCFGCGESGDIFAFVMKTQGLAFPEALKELAERAGVKLERRAKDGAPGPREAILDLHARAADFYQSHLASAAGAEARRYLAERFIDEAMIERFRIGLAPKSWDGFLKTVGNKVPREVLLTSGLFRAKSEGTGVYDFFRNRIIFPICDRQARPIAFGARKFTDDEGDQSPKYINSPESVIYSKGSNIYAIALAKDAIRRDDQAVLVEGYTDVIAAHRAGFTNVVAALGTALTTEQVTILARFGSRIILAYDPDAAGTNATERGIDIALDKGLDVRVAVLPGGLDPADAINAHGAVAFGKALDAAEDFIEHRIGAALSATETALDRGRAARTLVKSLGRLSDTIVRAAVTKRVAERFGVPEATLMPQTAPSAAVSKGVAAASSGLDTELALLRLMLDHGDLAIKARGMISPGDFSKEVRGSVFTALIDAHEKNERLTGDLGGRIRGLGLDLMAHIATAPSLVGEPLRLFDDYVKGMRMRKLDAEIAHCTVNLRIPDLAVADRDKMTMRLTALLKEKSSTMMKKEVVAAG